MKATKIGLIGLGNIGTGTARILLEDGHLIRKKLGWPLVLKKVADLDLERPRDIQLDRDLLTTDASEILNDPEIDIVVELIGGYEPAKTYILEAIAAGKHVVTANKALLATQGRDIFSAASAAGVDVLFESSVGGGIPIIRRSKRYLPLQVLAQKSLKAKMMLIKYQAVNVWQSLFKQHLILITSGQL